MQQAVNRTTEAFQRGLSWGRAGFFRGKLPVAPSEEGIVEIIKNLVDFALEGNLTEEQLRQTPVLSSALSLPTPLCLGKVPR